MMQQDECVERCVGVQWRVPVVPPDTAITHPTDSVKLAFLTAFVFHHADLNLFDVDSPRRRALIRGMCQWVDANSQHTDESRARSVIPQWRRADDEVDEEQLEQLVRELAKQDGLLDEPDAAPYMPLLTLVTLAQRAIRKQCNMSYQLLTMHMENEGLQKAVAGWQLPQVIQQWSSLMAKETRINLYFGDASKATTPHDELPWATHQTEAVAAARPRTAPFPLHVFCTKSRFAGEHCMHIMFHEACDEWYALLPPAHTPFRLTLEQMFYAWWGGDASKGGSRTESYRTLARVLEQALPPASLGKDTVEALVRAVYKSLQVDAAQTRILTPEVYGALCGGDAVWHIPSRAFEKHRATFEELMQTPQKLYVRVPNPASIMYARVCPARSEISPSRVQCTSLITASCKPKHAKQPVRFHTCSPVMPIYVSL